MDDSPYVIDEKPGLTHIRMRSTGECIGDIRTDTYLLLREELRRELMDEVRQKVREARV
jgi:hypothetical protein